jgi:hypothetical protein
LQWHQVISTSWVFSYAWLAVLGLSGMAHLGGLIHMLSLMHPPVGSRQPSLLFHILFVCAKYKPGLKRKAFTR